MRHKTDPPLPQDSETYTESEVLFVFAVIATCGKQYKVEKGDIIYLEKMDKAEGETISFENVLAISSKDGLVTGNPTVAKAKVEGKVLKNGRAKKIVVFRYKAKKNEKKKQGHRQPYTKVEITNVSLAK